MHRDFPAVVHSGQAPPPPVQPRLQIVSVSQRYGGPGSDTATDASPCKKRKAKRKAHRNNIVTVLMQPHGSDLQTASDIFGAHYAELAGRYLADRERLPSFGLEVDADVQLYVHATENWPIGNLAWSFETNRYSSVIQVEGHEALVELITTYRVLYHILEFHHN